MEIENTIEFLKNVVTSPEGYFHLSTKNGEDIFTEHWFKWPEQIPQLETRLLTLPCDLNIYFSAHLFSQPIAEKKYVLPTKTVQLDLDYADLSSLPYNPTVLVQSSPNRHQAFYIIDELLKIKTLEFISKSIAYTIPKCDHSGWSAGHRMRLPNTYNQKYDPAPIVTIAHQDMDRLFSVSSFNTPFEVLQKDLDGELETWVYSKHSMNGVGPAEIFHHFKLHTYYDKYMVSPAKDRSTALWITMVALFQRGADRDSVFNVAYNSPNNKFKDRPNGIYDLARDVLRCEKQYGVDKTHLSKEDVARIIENTRHAAKTMRHDKLLMIKSAVLKFMGDTGLFLKTATEELYYIDKVRREPMLISRNQKLLTMLDKDFGLNAADEETSFVLNALVTEAHSQPAIHKTYMLSYYDKTENVVYVHNGRELVFKVTTDDILDGQNGERNIVFPWPKITTPFYPDYEAPIDWGSLLFGNIPNAVELRQEEACYLLKTWFIFMLLRSAAPSRPILTLLGQPGSGKTLTFKVIYNLIFGMNKSIGSLSNADDFDLSMATNALYVIDNVDTYERWLPDRLALAAGEAMIDKRKLYTDGDVYTLHKQAMLGITAHNPKFIREDVVDRMLVITMVRRKDFSPEDKLIDNIMKHRNRLWASIMKDLQLILKEPLPKQYPKFRIEDFGQMGQRIANALGYGPQFPIILNKVVKTQRFINIEEDATLISSIQTLLTHKNGITDWMNATQLWSTLILNSPDSRQFETRYKNSVMLGRKIGTLQETLAEVMIVESELQSAQRCWRFSNR